MKCTRECDQDDEYFIALTDIKLNIRGIRVMASLWSVSLTGPSLVFTLADVCTHKLRGLAGSARCNLAFSSGPVLMTSSRLSTIVRLGDTSARLDLAALHFATPHYSDTLLFNSCTRQSLCFTYLLKEKKSHPGPNFNRVYSDALTTILKKWKRQFLWNHYFLYS